ncbi:MAG: 3-oxoadipate CoA-transferase, partial [Alcaligenaceae bacterium]|nr:3-oxoadipate CoA-transferase [Alcaligenaceae bacterium]
MINKIKSSHIEALKVITDGSSIMVGGFGDAGIPFELIDTLIEMGPTNLTIISN